MNKMKKILQLCSIVFLFSVAICSCKADFDNLVYLTVTFDSNTGTGTMEPQIFEENVPQLLSENKFTKEGYTFGGWATAADASEAEYADKAEFTAKEDITLYAIWKLIPPVPSKVTITYVSAYGSKPANKEVDKGYKLTSSDLPDLGETEDKYFEKWDKTVGTEITADTTITAAWETIYYLKNFQDIADITSKKSTIEKIVFTMDTYAGSSSTFDCSDTTGYFTGVLDGTTLTIYGNGRRMYAPAESQQFFYQYKNLSSIEFNNFYTSKVTNMMNMFSACTSLKTLNLSTFNTSSVTNMKAMFAMCTSLETLDVSSFNTSAVKDMNMMFASCKALTTLDLSSFDTKAVTDMGQMFSICSGLTTINVSSFNTTSVTTMYNMFNTCSALQEIDISTFTKGSVLTNVKNMFYSCLVLKTIYVNSAFDLSGLEASSNTSVFNSCSALVGGAGTKYDETKTNNTYAHIDGGASNPGYFTLKQ